MVQIGEVSLIRYQRYIASDSIRPANMMLKYELRPKQRVAEVSLIVPDKVVAIVGVTGDAAVAIVADCERMAVTHAIRSR